MALPPGSYNQTAFVVRDVERAAGGWTAATGAGPWYVLEVEASNTIYRGRPSRQQYRLALGFLGASFLELIQPVDSEPSIFNEVLEARGEGFHHVSPQISGLAGATFDARCRELEARGLEVAMSNDVTGAGRAVFYDALDSIGGFIEVFELGEGYPSVERLADTHLAWDGLRPIRPHSELFS